MTTLTEYALLANAAYSDTRGDPANVPVVPADWTRLDRTQFGLSTGPDPKSGFSAEVFRNGSEVIIAYEGTNPDLLSDDGLKDLFSNVKLYLSWAEAQLEAAARLYADVKTFFEARGEPVAISFTGHSLGGGLAGLMAVFFDRPATVFDPAPFQAVMNVANAQRLQRMFADADPPFSDAALNALAGADNFQETFLAREGAVDGQFVSGEILEVIPVVSRSASNTVARWPLTAISVGVSELDAVGLHSMQLLAALQASEQFKGLQEVVWVNCGGKSSLCRVKNGVSWVARN